MREAIRVRVAGSTARRVLAEPGEGAVFAAFERALYVEGERGLVCLGPLCLGRGPLNLLCADWRPGTVKPGTPAWWSRGEIRLAGGTVFSLAEAVDWRPPRPADWRPADLRRGLSALARAAARRAPPEGLGRLIPALVDRALRAAEDPASPFLRRAASGMAALAEWLARGAGSAPRPGPDALGGRFARRRPDRPSRLRAPRCGRSAGRLGPSPRSDADRLDQPRAPGRRGRGRGRRAAAPGACRNLRRRAGRVGGRARRNRRHGPLLGLGRARRNRAGGRRLHRHPCRRAGDDGYACRRLSARANSAA